MTERSRARGSAGEVLAAFLVLGLTSFGGPVAHIGYFREAFVKRRGWISEAAFADLVALCQFLPGPASSQVGFAIGLSRAGPPGALAAWIGFTLPSAIVMVAFAYGASLLSGPAWLGVIHGLKLVAVAVVAQAVWGMSRSLTPDFKRIAIAGAAIIAVSQLPASSGQIAAIALGGVAGLWLCRSSAQALTPQLAIAVSRRIGLFAVMAYFALLIILPLLAAANADGMAARLSAFYRSGALVFGGGHVVLPLLKGALVDPGWVGEDRFLAGYGAAQALPGPLFAFAAFLGAAMRGPVTGLTGGALALVAIFLPGLLALIAALPHWQRLRRSPIALAAMAGANAAVVGVLAAALYRPVFTGAVLDLKDFIAALTGLFLLTYVKAPPVVVVLLGVAFGLASAIPRS